MLRMYFLQLWFNLSDEGVEDAVYDSRAFSEFMGVSFGLGDQVPDATTLLKFRRIVEANRLGGELLACVNAVLEEKGVMMRGRSIVDATFIESPSSTKNREGARDPLLSGIEWKVALKPSTVRTLDAPGSAEREIESRKASARSKVEHPFLVVKRQFGWARTRYRGLAKNLERARAMFALANVAMWARAGCPELPAAGPA